LAKTDTIKSQNITRASYLASSSIDSQPAFVSKQLIAAKSLTVAVVVAAAAKKIAKVAVILAHLYIALLFITAHNSRSREISAN
jgi:hypothetical protein